MKTFRWLQKCEMVSKGFTFTTGSNVSKQSISCSWLYLLANNIAVLYGPVKALLIVMGSHGELLCFYTYVDVIGLTWFIILCGMLRWNRMCFRWIQVYMTTCICIGRPMRSLDQLTLFQSFLINQDFYLIGSCFLKNNLSTNNRI